MIDIPHHMALAVDVFEGTCAIAGSVKEETPIGFGKVLFSLGDTVEVVDFLMVSDSWHKDTQNLGLVAVTKRRCRPSCDFE
ncbi:hypothetical protein E3A20_06000 [Planctomyces bekefii]|uniref:Uncharacterized protein n=1 Tax=Planctomyces bekefii TaxID=1653850 RepID=A0A5C6M9D3_9PLAN|nr:hypothetical protein E3A20_06000 [Planctomyces bekefii]